MADDTIQCVDCPEKFVFSEREQEFYRDKGFSRPKRCKKCREKKKEQRKAKR